MNNIFTNKRNERRKGFTLIELAVAMGIFSIFMLIVLSIFSRVIFSQRRQIGEQELQEDLRLTLELFNREARLGFGETFETDGSTVSFRNQNGDCVVYAVEDETIVRREAGGVDSLILCSGAGYSNEDPITDDRTVVRGLTVLVSAGETSDEGEGLILTKQGMVTMIINAGTAGTEEVSMRLQSTVASRQTQTYSSYALPK